MARRYYCHVCAQIVNPIMEADIICPFCQNGFVEEMSSATIGHNMPESEFGSDRTLSLWAPILLGMMSNPHHRRQSRRIELDEEDDHNGNGNGEGETEYDRVESFLRRRRRSSATILQLLQGIRAGLISESNENNTDGDAHDRDRDRERERERVILINPFSQNIIVQGSYDWNRGQGDNNHTPIGSLGDYFMGPGLDLLLQHFAENDPNRYGTPPAQKDAIESLPTVKVSENLQCSVCLDDFEVGSEAKEMPCKHRFHSGCILPWLELHSSCPVCRFQLPVDESKHDSDAPRNGGDQRADVTSGHDDNAEGDSEGRNASGGRRFSFPWPFNGLFSSSSSSGNNANGNGTRSEDN